ncbi:MAG TPA: hypothetical protein VK889_11390 [Solirubrobacterales bacterium]|nr:hypothetical protein [Solirubrobacterales bacterium]
MTEFVTADHVGCRNAGMDAEGYECIADFDLIVSEVTDRFGGGEELLRLA